MTARCQPYLLIVLGACLLATSNPLPQRGTPRAPTILLNLSSSAPVGIWMRTTQVAQPGDWVAACLPSEVAHAARHRRYTPRGRCPSNTTPVLKILAARSGVVVESTAEGLLVDSGLWPGSRIQPEDRQGRPVTTVMSYPYAVPTGQVLLLTHHPQSWDGRYFGPLPEWTLLGTYRPLWTTAEER